MAAPILTSVPICRVRYIRTRLNIDISTRGLTAAPTVTRLNVPSQHGFIDLEPVASQRDGEIGYLDLVVTDDPQVAEAYGWVMTGDGWAGFSRTVAVPQDGPGVEMITTNDGIVMPAVWLDQLADFTGASGPVGSEVATRTYVDLSIEQLQSTPDPFPQYVLDSEGGGGATGGAGGVLSGNFPNPGFAQNMATQDELDAAIAAIRQVPTGGTTGQAVVKTATSYAWGDVAASGGSSGSGSSDFAPVAPLLHKLRTNRPVKVLILSSSTVAGYLLPTGSNTDAASYQAAPEGTGRQMLTQLATKYGNTNLTIVNAGVAGTSSLSWLHGGYSYGQVPAVVRKIKVEAPDVVLFQLNSNDIVAPFNRSAASLEVMLRRLYSEIKRTGVTLITIPPFTHSSPGGEYALYPDACYRAAAATGTFVVPIEATLQGATVGSARAGTTFDNLHPTVSGAQEIGAAFAAFFPAPSNRLPTVTRDRAPRGTWDDPARVAGFYEWVTAGGVTRRHHTIPVGEQDGWPVAAPPRYAGTNLMLRNSVFLTDCVQDPADPVAVRDLSGLGLDGYLGTTRTTTAEHPTWGTPGGLTFDGTKIVRIPFDTGLQRRDLLPGVTPITVRFVSKIMAFAGAATVVGHRGDPAAAPVGIYHASNDSISMYTHNNQYATAGGFDTYSYHDYIFTCWPFPDGTPNPQVKLYRDGQLVSLIDPAVPTSDVAGRAFDWTIGGRMTGIDPATQGNTLKQYNGVVQWVDIAASYIQDDAEAAALYAALKTKLVAERSLVMV